LCGLLQAAWHCAAEPDQACTQAAGGCQVRA
jgi:hypothetical protein